MNANVPNLSSLNSLITSESSPDISTTTPLTMNIANIPVIDDETVQTEETTSLSNQQKQQMDDSSDDDDDDEHLHLKHLKAYKEQIEVPVEEDEDEDEQDEVPFSKKDNKRNFIQFLCRMKKHIMMNYKNKFMGNNKK
jgi:hypothetical protein